MSRGRQVRLSSLARLEGIRSKPSRSFIPGIFSQYLVRGQFFALLEDLKIWVRIGGDVARQSQVTSLELQGFGKELA